MEYSWDGGSTWASERTTTYYEQHIDLPKGLPKAAAANSGGGGGGGSDSDGSGTGASRWFQAWQA